MLAVSSSDAMSSPGAAAFSATISVMIRTISPIRVQGRCGHVAVFVGVAPVEHPVRQPAQVAPGLHRYPQHLRDHHHGQVGRVLGDDVELAPVACAVEDLGGDGAADRRFEVVDGPGCEHA